MRIKSDYHTNGQLMEYIRHTESNVADIYKLRFFICLLDRGLIDCFNVLLPKYNYSNRQYIHHPWCG